MRTDLLSYSKFIMHGIGYLAGQLELTSACNQHCVFCKSWKDHESGECEAEMRFEVVKGILEQLNATPYFENLTLTGGEPQSWEPLEILLEIMADKLKFGLSINTNLTRDIKIENWRKFRSVRISLDSIYSKTYRCLRGVNLDPEKILNRLEELQHPNWSILNCVSNKNLKEITNMLNRLTKMKSLPRKVMFLPVLGERIVPMLDMIQYKKITKELSQIEYPFEVDFMGSVPRFKKEMNIESVPCYISRVSFHIKANGRVFPCCLVGGEAINTQKSMSLGDIYQDSLDTIRKRHTELHLHYASKATPCLKICQWKQINMNVQAHQCQKTKLSMP